MLKTGRNIVKKGGNLGLATWKGSSDDSLSLKFVRYFASYKTIDFPNFCSLQRIHKVTNSASSKQTGRWAKAQKRKAKNRRDVNWIILWGKCRKSTEIEYWKKGTIDNWNRVNTEFVTGNFTFISSFLTKKKMLVRIDPVGLNREIL